MSSAASPRTDAIPFLDLASETAPLVPLLVECFERVPANGRFILGGEVEALAREFAAYCGRRHGVGAAICSHHA